MKKNIAFSLSIQREIKKHRLNVESEVNKSMNELGIRTLLHKSGIDKEKGYPTIMLLCCSDRSAHDQAVPVGSVVREIP